MTNKKAFPLMLTLLLCFMFTLTGCFGKDNNNGGNNLVQFGEFGYNGHYLTSFATATISSTDAKQILSLNMPTIQPASAKATSSSPLPNSTQVNYILANYSGCEILTKYYEDGSDIQTQKVDALQGTDFRSMIETNQHTPFSQLVAKYILCFPELIDAMEANNAEFSNSSEALVAPFSNIFSYHKNNKGELVIQTRDFSEIPSSVGGGIGCSYRQDTEILYDADNKIQKWQTSLGLYSATPQGAMKQGYILEIEFHWIKKV